MTPQAVREQVLASGKVSDLVGLEDEGSGYPLVQFWGVMTCGLEYSVRGTRRGVSLEARTPEQHRHQTVIDRRRAFNPEIRESQALMKAICEAVLPWLAEIDGQTRAAPPPALLGAQELARVREAEQRYSQASQKAQESNFDRPGVDAAQEESAYQEAKQAADQARAQWEAIYREVYTWDAAS